MARIGCLIHLQNQIPKYNHNSSSILIKQSFYYVSVTTLEYHGARSVKQQTPNYIEITAINTYTSRNVYIDGWLLSILYQTNGVEIAIYQRDTIRNCFLIQNNTIHGIIPGWVDSRFLTLDRSTIIALCIKNI